MEDPVPATAVIPLPFKGDDLSVLNVKLSAILYVLHVGRSATTATGHVVRHSLSEVALARVQAEMRPHEDNFFQCWIEGRSLSLPAMDWDKDRGYTPSNPRPLKKAVRRAEALNRIYRTDRAEPCHYTFFTATHAGWMPLVTAVARVIGAEHHERVSSGKTSSGDDEVRTLETVVRTSRHVISRSPDCKERVEAVSKMWSLELAIGTRLRTASHPRTCLGKRRREGDVETEGKLEIEDKLKIEGDVGVGSLNEHMGRRADHTQFPVTRGDCTSVPSPLAAFDPSVHPT